MYRATESKTDVAPLLRCIIDLTSPNRVVADDHRNVVRYSRSLPVVYWPLKRRLRRDVSTLRMAFTKDMNDSGVGLITCEPIDCEELVVAFMIGQHEMDEPWYFQAQVRQRKQICSGFHQNGLQIVEFLQGWKRERLRRWDPLVTELLASAIT
jgi:hypothetical protein